MILNVKRRWLTEKSSIGELYIDGVRECFTLEDKTRGPDETKVFGATAIPTGTYDVTVEHSPHLSKLAGHDVDTPRLHGIPGFDGVLIHSGNTDADTEGCILVGQMRGENRIENSRAAFGALFPKIKAAIDRGERVTITVEVAA